MSRQARFGSFSVLRSLFSVLHLPFLFWSSLCLCVSVGSSLSLPSHAGVPIFAGGKLGDTGIICRFRVFFLASVDGVWSNKPADGYGGVLLANTAGFSSCRGYCMHAC